MADLLHRLGYVRKGHLVTVTRDDLVGQYIGHTAPKTKEVLKKAMGGVLFIDEAYYLYRPENERDYGQEAIEILLQVMENNRDDLVVILAGYADRMDRFFASQSRLPIAHRAPHRVPRLYRRRTLEDLGDHVVRAELRTRPRCAASDGGVHRRCAAASRISPMPARSATRSTGPGCARPTGSLQRPGARWMQRRFRPSSRPTCAPAGCSPADSTSIASLRAHERPTPDAGDRHELRPFDQDRPLDPLRRLRRFRSRDPRHRGSGRRLGACRRDGRPFRAQPHLRSARRRCLSPPCEDRDGRASDDRAGRPPHRRLRQGRRRHPDCPCGGRAAYPSDASGDPGGGHEGRRGAQSRHPGRGGGPTSRSGRPGLRDDGQSGLSAGRGSST